MMQSAVLMSRYFQGGRLELCQSQKAGEGKLSPGWPSSFLVSIDYTDSFSQCQEINGCNPILSYTCSAL